MTILFPCYPYDLKNVEPDFQAEYNAAKLSGFDIVLFSHDELTDENKVKLNKEPKSDMILRSWMLHGYQYHHLYSVINKRYGVKLLNSTKQYSYCHYYPNLYPAISEDSPLMSSYIPNKEKVEESLTITKLTTLVDYFKSLDDSEWNRIFRIFKKLDSDCILKDFVKSEKGTDLFIIKKDISFDDFIIMIINFVEARGKLFNVGLVFKKLVNLKKYYQNKRLGNLTPSTTNEWRAFYYNGALFNVSLNVDSNVKVDNEPPQNLLKRYENLNSNFYTIDFAELVDGSWIILEGGDGQVSGLATQCNEIEFYNNLKQQ